MDFCSILNVAQKNTSTTGSQVENQIILYYRKGKKEKVNIIRIIRIDIFISTANVYCTININVLYTTHILVYSIYICILYVYVYGQFI